MKKILAPASIIFSLLCLIVFFIAGLFVAGWLDVGAGQGLAGGAIVFWYGISFGAIALIGSILVTFFAEKKLVVKGNWILLVALLISISFVYVKAQQSSSNQNELDQPSVAPTIPSAYSILIIQKHARTRFLSLT